jgi:hypothetical protein
VFWSTDERVQLVSALLLGYRRVTLVEVGSSKHRNSWVTCFCFSCSRCQFDSEHGDELEADYVFCVKLDVVLFSVTRKSYT